MKQADEAKEQSAIHKAAGFVAATQKTIPSLEKAATQPEKNPGPPGVDSLDYARDRFKKQSQSLDPDAHRDSG
jgi:hypothetical protein